MRLRLNTKTGARVHGQMKLARLLESPESELERRIQALESGSVFSRLLESGVVTRQNPEHMRFANRRFAGRALRTSSEGLPELIDGNGDLAKLISSIGQEEFTCVFLGDDGQTDAQRAKLCGINIEDAKRLRQFVDKLYVQQEFEAPSPKAASEPTFSALASISIEDGKPVLGFFHREIWDRRYLINDERRRDLALDLPARDAKKAEQLLRELEFIDQRKTTLYRVLEAVLETQADYLISGAAGCRSRRKPCRTASTSRRACSIASSPTSRSSCPGASKPRSRSSCRAGSPFCATSSTTWRSPGRSSPTRACARRSKNSTTWTFRAARSRSTARNSRSPEAGEEPRLLESAAKPAGRDGSRPTARATTRSGFSRDGNRDPRPAYRRESPFARRPGPSAAPASRSDCRTAAGSRRPEDEGIGSFFSRRRST